jgi:hypothetical protein
VEKAFHLRFKAHRLYEGAAKSELFSFHTREAKQALFTLYAQYPAAILQRPTWNAAERQPDEASEQLQLFA